MRTSGGGRWPGRWSGWRWPAGFGLLAITYVALPGDGVLIGLVERVLLGTEIALVGVLAVRLAQLTWARSTSPPHVPHHAALG